MVVKPLYFFNWSADDVNKLCYRNTNVDTPPRSLMHLFPLRTKLLYVLVGTSVYKYWFEKSLLPICAVQVRTSSPSVISLASWNGPVTCVSSASAPSSTRGSRFPLQSTSSPRLWTARPVRCGFVAPSETDHFWWCDCFGSRYLHLVCACTCKDGVWEGVFTCSLRWGSKCRWCK